MSDFNNNWRRKQELKMRPYADIIYRQVFGNDIEIQRFEREDNKTLDIVFAIDVQIRLKNGQILLGQEKYLSHKYANFKSLTVEYEQNPLTHEQGDWFKIAAQFYFTGYITEKEDGFNPWVIANWTTMVIDSNQGSINWTHNHNQDGYARASFVYTNMTQLPNHCIISCSWK
jgi:hypothetical protein